MSDSIIASTIRRFALVSGMPMMNINGKEIPNSCVIDAHAWVYCEDDGKRVRLFREEAISGKQIEMSFSPEAFATLQNCKILEIP